MKYFFLLFTIIFFSLNAWSQIDRESIPDNNADIIKLKSNSKVFGKVVDLQTKKPVELASIELMYRVEDTVAHRKKDSVIAAMLSKPNGDFSFENVPLVDSLRILISAVGYSIHNDYISFAPSNIYQANPVEKDLGNIVMGHISQKLEEVTVELDKPALQMGIDKKIFDVNKSLTSKGGTAIDIMKNIPSVSVDVDGNIEFRNSSPTIFIDGRPTILTLDQIPSDNIDIDFTPLGKL